MASDIEDPALAGSAAGAVAPGIIDSAVAGAVGADDSGMRIFFFVLCELGFPFPLSLGFVLFILRVPLN